LETIVGSAQKHHELYKVALILLYYAGIKRKYILLSGLIWKTTWSNHSVLILRERKKFPILGKSTKKEVAVQR
jgi:hypothetical protein